ncbi:CBS domain-containing protein [Brevundimonas sp.]|uniref:CBS domain-containing protein n=1 Tax=Brevundimonas sp. TaxID=1871086 RepID=UPI0025C54DBF|nr:CBS domain-containing protein [Brevundimonas sp.]
MPLIGDFVDLIAPVAPSTLGAEVFERFQNEPNTLALAVVDDQGRPLGVIERNAFTLRMAAEFGRALYARKPADSLMDRNAPVAEASASAETFFDAYDAAELGTLLSGFIVVSNGRYVGVGTALQVVQAGAAVHRQRAEAMGALARDLALAANADERDEMDYVAAGMNGVAQKPIQPDALLNAIRLVMTAAETNLSHAA